MIGSELEAARRLYIEQSPPDQLETRPNSDFLMVENYEGDIFDFHSLGHSCGSWLSMQSCLQSLSLTSANNSGVTQVLNRLNETDYDESATRRFGNTG